MFLPSNGIVNLPLVIRSARLESYLVYNVVFQLKQWIGKRKQKNYSKSEHIHQHHTLLTPLKALTHWGWVTHRCVSKLAIIGSDNGACRLVGLSHYLNQCWNIVYWISRNKLQWNFKRNSRVFMHENPFQNVVWKMASIFFSLGLIALRDDETLFWTCS